MILLTRVFYFYGIIRFIQGKVGVTQIRLCRKRELKLSAEWMTTQEGTFYPRCRFHLEDMPEEQSRIIITACFVQMYSFEVH